MHLLIGVVCGGSWKRGAQDRSVGRTPGSMSSSRTFRTSLLHASHSSFSSPSSFSVSPFPLCLFEMHKSNLRGTSIRHISTDSGRHDDLSDSTVPSHASWCALSRVYIYGESRRMLQPSSQSNSRQSVFCCSLLTLVGLGQTTLEYQEPCSLGWVVLSDHQFPCLESCK